jgi:2-polyprenyl-3-methyl-5-hydroxy-6-metoxy-1,4-benzoquinol methylase
MPHYRLHRDPRSSHQQISKRLRELGRGPVLDVGAAQGMLGELLSDSGLAIDAVEPNPQWAEACKPFYRRVMTGQIETAAVPEDSYRVIVCADVLEHTPDPLEVLLKLNRLAAPDAVYLISLPNVAHLAVRLMLLVGIFPQMERGILDKTHRHFFTRASASRLLQRAGLKIAHIGAAGVPLDELWPSGEGSAVYNGLMAAQYACVKVLPKLLAMQFIFEANRIDSPVSPKA